MQLQTVQICVSLTSLLSVPILALQAPPLPVSTVSSFGLGFWIENLAVRSSGEILVVGPFNSSLYQVDPLAAKPTPEIVYTFPSPITGLLGITETSTDVFYVTAGNISSHTLEPVSGDFSVWEVNMANFDTTGKPSLVREVAEFPNAGYLDGMTTVDAASGLLEISDTALGLVWSLDVDTGAMSEVINLPDMKSIAGDIPQLGVNGLHYTSGDLYYTSTDQQLLVSLPISPSTGAASGNPTVIASKFGMPDDFALDNVDNAYVAVNSTALCFIQTNGKVTVLAGGPNTATLPGITSAKFGRTSSDNEVLYIGTTGGSFQYPSGHFTTPGALLKINIGAAGYFDYA